MTDETCEQSDLAHKPTRVPDGVPPLQVPTWPAPGAPRRYWTVVTHYGAADPKHRDEECGFEVYDADGAPFRTTFYASDEAMVWCANWLAMKKAK